MPTLRELYLDIPQQCGDGSSWSPRGETLPSLFRGIKSAYSAAGLRINGQNDQSPGFENEEGTFQVSKTANNNSGMVERVHLLAASPDGSAALEGDVITRLGSVFVDFRAIGQEDVEPREVGLTRKSWQKIGQYVWHAASSGMLVPVPTKSLVAPQQRVRY